METSVLMYATRRVLNFPDICLGKVAKFPRREDHGETMASHGCTMDEHRFPTMVYHGLTVIQPWFDRGQP